MVGKVENETQNVENNQRFSGVAARFVYNDHDEFVESCHARREQNFARRPKEFRKEPGKQDIK